MTDTLERLAASFRADSPVPLYFQVKELLRRELAATGAPPGSPIPSESALQDALRVSRVTIRRAISELVADGVLTSKRGLGHFVADPAKAGVQCLRSFTEDALRAGHTPTAQLLAFEMVALDPAIAAQLGVPPGTDVRHVKRLRFLDGVPIYVSDAYLRKELTPGMTRRSFSATGKSQSLYRALGKIPGLQVVEGQETTTAVIADRDVASLFGIDQGVPLIQKSCLLRNNLEEPVLYEQALWAVSISADVKLEVPDTRVI